MISVRHLTKEYGNFKALDNVSFDIKTGSLVGLLGPNGAGKTTLMDILAGVSRFQEGTVLVSDNNIETQEDFKAQVGYLPDQPCLYLDMNIQDYLQYVALLKKVPKNKIQKQVESVLEKLDLTQHRSHLIGQLSAGYRQRVGIAQALINDPKILILDEPTTGLDPHQRVLLKKIVTSLKNHSTLLFSTHILSDVEDICDDVILISEGRLKTSGSLDNLTSLQESESKIFQLSLRQNVKKSDLFLIPEVNEVENVSESAKESKWQITFSSHNDRLNDHYLSKLASKNWGIGGFSPVSQLERLFQKNSDEKSSDESRSQGGDT